MLGSVPWVVLKESAEFLVEESGTTNAPKRKKKKLSLLFNTLSRFVTVFLPRSKRLLISWLQSPSTVIL